MQRGFGLPLVFVIAVLGVVIGIIGFSQLESEGSPKSVNNSNESSTREATGSQNLPLSSPIEDLSRTQSSQDSLSVSTILQKKDELVGKKILVEGKVIFTLECPPTGQNPLYPQKAVCFAIGHIADKDTGDLLYADPRAIVLYKDKHRLSCATFYLVSLNCQGLVNEREHRIEGILDYEAFEGKKSNTLILEVLSSQII